MKRIQIKYIIKNKQTLFTFHDEGHTFGNFIRFILKNIEIIEFSGYNVPHPSENIMNLRIITKKCINHIQLLILGIKISGEFSILADNFFILTVENYFRFYL
jgi:DNA-directed RNA polymerase I and III subunit RPAC2